MPHFLITMPPLSETDVKRAWLKVLKTRRTADEHSLKMDRAYVDSKTGKTVCCWEAVDQAKLEQLFAQAGVVYESMTVVTEVLETDLK